MYRAEFRTYPSSLLSFLFGFGEPRGEFFQSLTCILWEERDPQFPEDEARLATSSSGSLRPHMETSKVQREGWETFKQRENKTDPLPPVSTDVLAVVRSQVVGAPVVRGAQAALAGLLSRTTTEINKIKLIINKRNKASRLKKPKMTHKPGDRGI